MADDMQTTGPDKAALRAKRASIPGDTLDLPGDLPGRSMRRVVKESMLFFWPMASIAEEGREFPSGDLPPRAEDIAARRASAGDTYTLR
ncbi:Hypp4877 [Branchiostoma lanceolatum]|uniref:Hypp4877 protein n=1 Tax=Branchiostoma lanceolatum TaxID=7740 RepID=A0A8K0EXH9_BRALA|nr:Hypp4877 [Branchiostoma lanceolatum]